MLKQGNNSKIKKNLFTRSELYAVLSFFGFVLGILLFTYFTPNYFQSRIPIQIKINSGMTLNSVIDSLYEKKVIPGKIPIKVAAILYGAENKIKAGLYEIPNGLTYFELIELLLKGAPSEQKIVTIPEGIWQHDLAGLLMRKLQLDSAKIMSLSSDKGFIHSLGLNVNNLEGYLLPETYFIFPHSSEEEVLRKLKFEMDKLFDKNAEKQMKKLGMNKHQILTLASIVEGESNIDSEFRKIAGVYYNRLKKGMRLQADPTIQYLKRHRKRNKIYYKDLEIESPFNTYKYSGLPPAPINNPGKAAVKAAMYPEINGYYYFVADGTGKHRFAKTLSQHNHNVMLYRKWRRNQN